jgi:hypothetical protein
VDFLGIAALIHIGLVEQYWPFISATAQFLSFSSANFTNPYPLGLPIF